MEIKDMAESPEGGSKCQWVCTTNRAPCAPCLRPSVGASHVAVARCVPSQAKPNLKQHRGRRNAKHQRNGVCMQGVPIPPRLVFAFSCPTPYLKGSCMQCAREWTPPRVAVHWLLHSCYPSPHQVFRALLEGLGRVIEGFEPTHCLPIRFGGST